MALITVSRSGKPDNFAVLGGTLASPRIGAWYADLVIDRQQALSGKVEIKIGATTLVGTVSRGSLHAGVMRARIVAGVDGLRKTAKAKHYTNPSVRNVLSALSRDSGETISSTADSSILETAFAHWTTLAHATGFALRILLDAVGSDVSWRHLPDGTIWIGRETWPASGIKNFVEISETPEQAVLELGLEEPVLMAGKTINGRKADYVQYDISGGAIRTTVVLL